MECDKMRFHRLASDETRGTKDANSHDRSRPSARLKRLWRRTKVLCPVSLSPILACPAPTVYCPKTSLATFPKTQAWRSGQRCAPVIVKTVRSRYLNVNVRIEPPAATSIYCFPCNA